jgi:hypothetical protein
MSRHFPQFTYECPACEHAMEFEIEPLIRGRYCGPPESCYPDEGGSASGPENCPACGEAIDATKVYDKWEVSSGPEPDIEDHDTTD